jgi:drug/metabolite transporter (DMT)-like permease
VIGVVATVLVLGERPSTADIVGFALIFTASACVVFAPLLRATPLGRVLISGAMPAFRQIGNPRL